MTSASPTDPAAPPPPGADTPVPVDAEARAAAAGRARQRAAPATPAPDGLVPTTAVENRAADRARMRRERLGVVVAAPLGVGNPAAGMPASGLHAPPGLMPAVEETVPQRFAPAGWSQQPYLAQAYPVQQYAVQPYATQPYPVQPYAAQPYPVQPYAAQPYATQPYPMSAYTTQPYPGIRYAPMPAQPIAPMLPPRIPWSRRQRSAALLSSWTGQTLMALATHLLTAFFLIVGFAFLLHSSGEPIDDFEGDSFTSVIARWTMGDRVWATVLIGLLVGGGLLAAGWLLNALWARSAGLAKPHRATWLAWLCTTAATGVIGVMVWPAALIFGFMGVLLSSGASLTTGTMWSTLFWLLGIAVVLTGGVGLLFGWMFLSTSRPRVDVRAIAEAEEAAARARDEAELADVRLRGEPSVRPSSQAGAAPYGGIPR